MKRGLIVVFMTMVASLTLFAQQESFKVGVYSDMNFSEFTGVLDVNTHFRASDSVVNLPTPNTRAGNSPPNYENEALERVRQINSELSMLTFDFDIQYEELRYNYLNPAGIGALAFDYERSFLAYALAENFGKLEINQNNQSSVKIVISSEKRDIPYSISDSSNNRVEIPVFVYKHTSQAEQSDFEVVYNGEVVGNLNLSPGWYSFTAGEGDNLITNDNPLISCVVLDKKLNYKANNKDGQQRFFFTVFDDYTIQNGLHFINGRRVSVGKPNLLAEAGFYPNNNIDYLNQVLVKMIASSTVSPLTIGEVSKLTTENVSIDDSTPLASRSVSQIYSLFFTKYNSLTNMLITNNDLLAAQEILVNAGNSAPNDNQKRIEAERQKIIWFIRNYKDERKDEALKILTFVLKFANVENAEKTAILMARNIAEWKILNPDWEVILTRQSFRPIFSGSTNKRNAFYFDYLVGMSVPVYSTNVISSPDFFLRTGFGLNFGNSYLYLTGMSEIPVYGTNIDSILNALNYSVRLDTNIRFVDFFELQTDGVYYQNGRVQVVLKPNFDIFDVFEIGGFVDFDVLPEIKFRIGAETSLFNSISAGISHDISSSLTTVYSVLKL